MDVAYDNMHPPSSETGTGVPFVKAQALKVQHLIMEGCALLRSGFLLICFQTSLHNQQQNNIYNYIHFLNIAFMYKVTRYMIQCSRCIQQTKYVQLKNYSVLPVSTNKNVFYLLLQVIVHYCFLICFGYDYKKLWKWLWL